MIFFLVLKIFTLTLFFKISLEIKIDVIFQYIRKFGKLVTIIYLNLINFKIQLLDLFNLDVVVNFILMKFEENY